MAELHKHLGYKTILLITINSIIGSGLFFLPAIGVRYAGPASIIAWIIISIIAIYTAMCFAELISMFPKAGGIYEFSKNAYGKFTSFLVGWTAWLVGNITTAMLIVGAIQYILPYNTPEFIFMKILICLFWVVAFNAMAYFGIRTSAIMLVTFAFITLSLVLVIIIPSIIHFDISKLDPFFIYEDLSANITFIFITIFFISEAFFGLESVTFLAEETKNPEKILPKAFIKGTIIIAILTLILVISTLGVIHYSSFGNLDAPFAEVANQVLGPVGKTVVVLGTYLVIIGAAAGWIVTTPRLLLALTRDKLFITQIGKIHKKYKTPYKAIVFQGVITGMLVIISFFRSGYETLLSMLVPLVLMMIGAAVLTTSILRYKQPDTKRHYHTAFGKSGPVLLALVNISLVVIWVLNVSEASRLLIMALSLVAAGIPVYLLLELYYNPKTIVKVRNLSAYISIPAERVFLPNRVLKKISLIIGSLKNKKILEFGCSLVLTKEIQEHLGNAGILYILDNSKSNMNITKKRVGDPKNIIFLFDPYLDIKFNKVIPKVDVLISAGMISYVSDIEKIINSISSKLKKGAKVCFVDFDRIFHIIPNVEWIRNEEYLKRIFRKNNIRVHVTRQKGVLWEYVFIYGEKV